MATGFAAIQRNNVNKDPGYKTLFERVSAKTGGEKKSLSWYRAAVKNEAAAYKKNFSKYILNERSDRVGAVEEQDANELRRYTCLLYTSPSPRDRSLSRMPSSA